MAQMFQNKEPVVWTSRMLLLFYSFGAEIVFITESLVLQNPDISVGDGHSPHQASFLSFFHPPLSYNQVSNPIYIPG